MYSLFSLSWAFLLLQQYILIYISLYYLFIIYQHDYISGVLVLHISRAFFLLQHIFSYYTSTLFFVTIPTLLHTRATPHLLFLAALQRGGTLLTTAMCTPSFRCMTPIMMDIFPRTNFEPSWRMYFLPKHQHSFWRTQLRKLCGERAMWIF